MGKQDQSASRIDGLMERASAALVARAYFQCERLCVDALNVAHHARDYERMARVLLPLQEARRQKRQLAVDAGRVVVVDGDLPLPGDLKPGCYLVRPPRVGLDGQMLRESLDGAEIAGLVVTREPTTRTGQTPVVALGPVTVRVRLDPTPELMARSSSRGKRASGAKIATKIASKATASGGAAGAAGASSSAPGDEPLPTSAWFEHAMEALGDAAIAQVDDSRSVWTKVDELMLRLTTVPDHELLHQVLASACRDAAKAGPPKERLDRTSDGDEDDLDADEPDEREEPDDAVDEASDQNGTPPAPASKPRAPTRPQPRSETRRPTRERGQAD